MDYLSVFGIPIFDPDNFAPDAIRSICFDVFIVDDLLYEDVESFNISLELDTFIAQSGIRVDPSLTEIFILDNDGKDTHSYRCKHVHLNMLSFCPTP